MAGRRCVRGRVKKVGVRKGLDIGRPVGAKP